MTDPLVERLRAQLGGPRDGALLRFSLGNAFLGDGAYADAAQAFRDAIDFDPHYSAAWKLLGKALADSGKPDEAMAAYRQGIAAASEKGDKQAAKEMSVFLRRLEKATRP
jgi:Tfp pilus assembly protein PilF